MDDHLFEPDKAASYIRTPTATLQWWRHMGRGPKYLKVGRRVFYRKSALDEFLAAGEVMPGAA